MDTHCTTLYAVALRVSRSGCVCVSILCDWLTAGWLCPEHSLVASEFATLTGLKESLGYFSWYLESVSACLSLVCVCVWGLFLRSVLEVCPCCVLTFRFVSVPPPPPPWERVWGV